jgi:hypothetical protein
VRDVGGRTEAVVVLVTTEVLVGPAAQDPRRTFAKWLDAEEQVGNVQTVYDVIKVRGWEGITPSHVSQVWRTSYAWSRWRPAMANLMLWVAKLR